MSSFARLLLLLLLLTSVQAEVSEWEDEAHRRLAEADEKQRAADRCTRDGANARRELERLKKAVESSFEDLQRQVCTFVLDSVAPSCLPSFRVLLCYVVKARVDYDVIYVCRALLCYA